MELRTVRKSDPEFQTLLDGTFSNSHRAIPLRPMNQNIIFELATFKLTPVEKIERPPLFSFVIELLKPQHFLLVLIPLFYTFLSLPSETLKQTFTLKIFLLMTSLLNLTLFINLRRTLTEHYRLSHLYASATTSSILQMGWLKGITVKRISLVFFAIAIVTALPLVIEQPIALSPIVLLTLILFAGMNLQKEGTLYLITSALNHFLLAGPLVVLGTCIVFHTKPTLTQWAFALSWGLWVLLWRQLRSFREVMPFSLSKSSRFVAQMGFDKTRSLLMKLIITIPMICLWLISNVLVHSYFIIKEMESLNKTQSSLSSHLEELAIIAQKHHYSFAITLITLSILTL
jgi:hypothetical protein